MKRTTTSNAAEVSTSNATTSNAKARRNARKATTAPAPLFDATNGRLNLAPRNTLAELVADIQGAFDMGFTGIDAKAAYLFAPTVFMPETPETPAGAELNAANLANALDAVRATLANMGKGTGTSSLFNVLDGRTCHGIRGRKLATRLGSSRALAAFIDTYMGALARSTSSAPAMRVNSHGTAFECDRRQWQPRAAVNA